MNRTTLLRLAFATAAATFAGSSGATVFAPDPNDSVKSVLALPDGDILVGGDFTQIADTTHFHLARLNADGSSDDAFAAGTNDTVWTIVAQSDGKILIGGDFSAVNGVEKRGVARLNADGSLDATFAAPQFAAGVGYRAGVGEIHLQADGKIVLVGSTQGGFTSVNGKPRLGIARLNADGTLDEGFVPGISGSYESSPIFSAAIQADGKIVVGGDMYEGSQAVQLRRLNANGSLDSGFRAGGFDRYVRTLQLQSNGDILALGEFSAPYPQLARFHSDGSLDAGYDVAARLPFATSAILLQNDGRLLVSGQNADGGHLVRLNADGSQDASLPEQRFTYIFYALGMQADGKILVGGYIESIGGYARRNMARLNADGSVDIPLHSVTPAPGAGGSLSPAVAQSVREGETTRFLVLPDAGHRVQDISGCGGSLQGAYYVTGAITADCTVTATFAEPEQAFTVTPNPANGSLSPGAPQSVRFGQTASFTLTPDPGFYFSKANGCDGRLDGSVFTTAPISADCTVRAEFVAPTGASATGGSQQSASTGSPFATPLSVRVISLSLWDGRPVAGVPVRFEVPGSGASAILSSAVALTDADGVARVSATANGVAGGYAVKALVDGLPLQPVYFALSNETADGADLELKVTMSTEPPPACGSATRLDVAAGTPVNYCFTVVNRGPVALNYQTLGRWPLHFFWVRDHDYALYMQPVSIAPGATYRYNKVMAAGSESVDERYTWSGIAQKPGYAVDLAANETFIDISGSATALSMSNGTAAVPMPFAWNFYGRRYSPDDGYHLCVNARGNVVLSLADTDSYCPPYFRGDNDRLEGDFANGILAYWDALGDNGAVYTQVVGNAPNRRLIVQWQDKDHATHPNAAGGITFEAIIDETSGRIVYVYRDLDFDLPGVPALNYGGSATIGVYGNDVVGSVLPPGALHDGQAVSFTPIAAPHTASAETHLHVGTPTIQATPTAINASAAAGSQATRTLRIGNGGNLPLEWSLARAPATAHFPSTARWLAPLEKPASHGSSLPSEAMLGNHGGTPTSGTATDGTLTIPAYGAMQEGTFGYPTPNWFVGFDAAAPDYFVPLPAVAYNVLAGDFIDDDFSKEYVIYRDTDTLISSIAIVDFAQGGVQPIADILSIDQRWSGMAWDRTTDTLFVTSASTGSYGQPCDQGSLTGTSTLYTMDRYSGQFQILGNIVFEDGRPLCVSDIAVSPGGEMYGIDLLNDALLAIDKTNGRAAVIGSLGVNLKEINSIDFDDASGTLYLAAEHFAEMDTPDSGGIYTIDLVTGLARRLARYPLSSNNHGYLQVDALAIARSGGQCAFPGEIAWLRSDVDSGSAAPGQSSPVNLTLDASGLAVGSYAANVCISSNDPAHSLLSVPVAFSVTPTGTGDAIFRNGFDATVR